MNKNAIDDISAIINEKLEKIYDTAVTMANIRLLNYYEDTPSNWKRKQVSDIAVLKREVSNLVKKEIKPLFSSMDRALLLLGAVASGTFKGMDDLDAKEIKLEMVKDFDKKIQKVKKQVAKDLNRLPNLVGKMQNDNINKIKVSIGKDPRITTLYDGILKQTQMGIDNSPKIRYKDGRDMQFNNYMNMNVRTTFQQVGNSMQEQAGREAGLIFWICSSHGDCAHDHADYQGKIYVDEHWQDYIDEKDYDRVKRFIVGNNIQLKQSVENDEPYLCTRPNCRHYFMPLSIDEVIDEPREKLLKDRGMIKGSYDSEKYQNLQRQRHEERQIRKYKQRLEQDELSAKKLPKGEERDALEKRILKDKKLVKSHQANVRTLIKEHPYLDRDYDRENPRIVVNDLGVRFDVKYKEK